MVEPVYDRACLASQDHTIYHNKNTFPNRVTNLLAENLFSLNLCFYLNEKSSLINEMDKKLLRLTNHGFISKWVSDYVNKKYLQDLKRDVEAEPLNFDQLMICFKIMACGWLIGSLILLLEILYKKFRHY